MTMRDSTRAKKRREREFDRQMLRAAFQSLFLGVIQERKKKGYMLQQLAEATDNLKSTVSRWFSPNPPNWQIDTMADIAEALDLALTIEARDRKTGDVYTPQGPRNSSASEHTIVTPVYKFPVVLRGGKDGTRGQSSATTDVDGVVRKIVALS